MNNNLYILRMFEDIFTLGLAHLIFHVCKFDILEPVADTQMSSVPPYIAASVSES